MENPIVITRSKTIHHWLACSATPDVVVMGASIAEALREWFRMRDAEAAIAAELGLRPWPPEVLVSALQDRIHPTSGRLLQAKKIRMTKKKATI